MNPSNGVQDVARRFASRPGCRFIGAREVGIAVFVMDLRVIIIEAQDVPPIDEFLLRSLKLAIDSPEELSNFLGLDRRTVDNRLVELRRAELIEVLPGSDPAVTSCRLTSRGEAAAANLHRAETKEVTLPRVAYHGFARKPLLVPEERLLRPKDLPQEGIPSIPAIPARPPRPDELRLEDIAAVVRTQWQRKRKGHVPELVTVRSILRDIRTKYLPAVLLQYELIGGKRQQHVAFAVDGVLDEDAGRAFAACKGIQRIPELLAEGYASTADLAAEYLKPHEVKQLGPLGDVDELVEKLEVADAQLLEKESVAEEEDRSDTKLLLKQEVEQLKATKAELEKQLSFRKARRLRTFDCSSLLKATIRSAKERLVIVSAFLSSNVVNDQFLKDLEGALGRGVKVWVAYGMSSQGARDAERERSWDWEEAEAGLQALKQRHNESFQMADLGNTHEKILIKDSEFVVSGSFNWLSFRGDPRKKYRLEDALLVTDSGLIEEYFAEITKRFGAAKQKGRS
jgi:hypothetical protein